MNKMAALNGKNISNSSSEPCDNHETLQGAFGTFNKVNRNDDPGLTSTYFMARSILISKIAIIFRYLSICLANRGMVEHLWEAEIKT